MIKGKKIISALLIGTLCLEMSTQVRATEIDDTKQKAEELQKQKEAAVSEQITEKKDYKKFLKAEAQYSSLTEAYDAYVKALADPKYEGVRATQTSAP